MILVDDLRGYAKVTGYRGRPTAWCHLVSTVDEAELHAFADRLGLRREWFQSRERGNASCAHYDITRSVRAQAVKLGAEEVTGRELALLNYDGMRRRGLLKLHPFQEDELRKRGIPL